MEQKYCLQMVACNENCGSNGEGIEKSKLVEGKFSATQSNVEIAYPENFDSGNCYIRAFNILAASGYVTVYENGVYAQLRKDSIYLTIGSNDKFKGYGFLLELARKQ